LRKEQSGAQLQRSRKRLERDLDWQFSSAWLEISEKRFLGTPP
jgi:hypothetical protein